MESVAPVPPEGFLQSKLAPYVTLMFCRPTKSVVHRQSGPFSRFCAKTLSSQDFLRFFLISNTVVHQFLGAPPAPAGLVLVRGRPHGSGCDIVRDTGGKYVMAMSWCYHGLEARNRLGIDRGTRKLVRTFNRTKKITVYVKLGHF